MFRVLAFVLVLLIATPDARAGEPADSIQGVIISQLHALHAGNLPAAFAYASPTIQSKFGTPERFGRMVAAGYPMIWRPARYKMLSLFATREGQIQTVLFQDRQSRLFEAVYDMRWINGAWRINGVYVRSMPGMTS